MEADETFTVARGTFGGTWLSASLSTWSSPKKGTIENEEVDGGDAPTAGVPLPRPKVCVQVVCGLRGGLGGLFQFGRLSGQGDPTSAVGLELDIIAATVIGGASLNGGRGSILGSLVGAFMMTYMRNRCDHLQWPSFVQQMIVGHIIIAAVAVDLWRQRRTTAR